MADNDTCGYSGYQPITPVTGAYVHPSSPPHGATLRPGQMVGNYRLMGLLGRGGMGEVYLAEYKDIERRAAIKVLYPQFARYPQVIARFLNEARAVNRARHPGLVEIFEYGVLQDGSPYLIMEYLEGELLSQRILEARGAPLPRALELARQVALALAAVHERGIVHRDLKPQNVMVVPDPLGPERAKVIDFGVARIEEEGDAADAPLPIGTVSGVTLGTPQYMSPEQCLGASSVDGKADVYALGVILYEMLSGRLPFLAELNFDYMAQHVRAEPPPLQQIARGVSDEVAALVHRLLRKLPAERPTMTEVARQLGALCGVKLVAPSARSPLPVDTGLLPTMLLTDDTATPDMTRRVLVVDDDADLLEGLCEFLGDEGFVCQSLHGGEEAIAAMRRQRPHMVLLDVELPGKSGYKLCWEIKSDPVLRDTLVVLMSGKTREADQRLGLVMQADAYLPKPFDLKELLAVVQLLLDRPGG